MLGRSERGPFLPTIPAYRTAARTAYKVRVAEPHSQARSGQVHLSAFPDSVWVSERLYLSIKTYYTIGGKLHRSPRPEYDTGKDSMQALVERIMQEGLSMRVSARIQSQEDARMLLLYETWVLLVR